ncbi:hypothetical protein [Microbacterium sp.]|uniref:hypothetical protein n=1 Tax=Microbacterium sp. TaxID=51671 RepID=UPI0039195D55
MPFHHHPRQLFPHQMRASLTRPPRSESPARVPRQAFTDRLGLPADATNDQVLAAVDKVVAPSRVAPAPTLADKAWGTPAAALPAAQSALYRKAWG